MDDLSRGRMKSCWRLCHLMCKQKLRYRYKLSQMAHWFTCTLADALARRHHGRQILRLFVPPPAAFEAHIKKATERRLFDCGVGTLIVLSPHTAALMRRALSNNMALSSIFGRTQPGGREEEKWGGLSVWERHILALDFLQVCATLLQLLWENFFFLFGLKHKLMNKHDACDCKNTWL